jgi:large subunit ribosomal protein L24
MMTTDRNRLTLRKDDMVQVMSGKDKGKTGKILKIDPNKSRVTVEKINMVKRHIKPSQKNPQGGILEKESGIHYSNILLMCGKCGRGRRHGMKLVEKAASKKGSKAADKNVATQMKIRVCKRCGETLGAA